MSAYRQMYAGFNASNFFEVNLLTVEFLEDKIVGAVKARMLC